MDFVNIFKHLMSKSRRIGTRKRGLKKKRFLTCRSLWIVSKRFNVAFCLFYFPYCRKSHQMNLMYDCIIIMNLLLLFSNKLNCFYANDFLPSHYTRAHTIFVLFSLGFCFIIQTIDCYLVLRVLV